MLSFLRRALPLLLLAALGLGVYLVKHHLSTYRFSDWEGPMTDSSLPAAVAADISRFSAGSEQALAVLVTDPASDWLGLAHGLKAIGIPFVMTTRHDEALAHKVVLAYPTISGRRLSAEALRALAAHPRQGGTLVGFEILGGGLAEVFGFSETTARRDRKHLRLAAALPGQAGPAPLVSLAGPAGGVPAHAFSPTTAVAAAYYDDGSVAALRRDFAGGGRAYALGIDLGAYIAKAHNGRQDLGRHYINRYEPGVDVFLRLLQEIYRAGEPLAVTFGSVPFGKSASVVITHDIDYTRSIENAVKYAQFERDQGITATYFIQTKYVRDWNDDIFFNQHGAELTRQLASLGMEIGSHSVSHARAFSGFPMGSGKERYPAYTPRVTDKDEASGGTLLGELRVSRFLLQQAVPDAAVTSFRPGHLEYPFDLPQALQATGFRFSSTLSGGTALTYLPFRLNHARANLAETSVFEFPIAIEDELQRPMTNRLAPAVEMLDTLREYGGTCVVLIHPDVFDDKLAFLEGFVSKAKARDVWFGSLGQLGAWWSARDAATVGARRTADGIEVTLHVAEAVSGLALQVPAGWRLAPESLDDPALRQAGNQVLVTHGPGTLRLSFRERG